MAVYNLFGKNGRIMERIEETGLALGQVVSYENQAVPRQKAVVTSIDGGPCGQPCIFVESFSRSTVSKTSIDGPGGWRYENDEPWTPAQIQELEAKANQALIDAKISRDAAAAEFKNKVAELIKENPHLEAGGGWQTAAKNMRVELKRAFPGVKFSVTGKSFSMGNSVSINWTDGPTSKQVEKITGRYSSGSFDGMTDCYNYNTTAWSEAFGSSKYVHENRHYSPELIARAIAELVAHYGDYETPTVEQYQHGNADKSPIQGANPYYDSWQSLITRKCSEIDCTAPAVEVKPEPEPAPEISRDDCEIEKKIIALLEEQNKLLRQLSARKA
jgi:Large polyvalent protein associated domain 29